MRSASVLISHRSLWLTGAVLLLAIAACSSEPGGDDEVLTSQLESSTTAPDGEGAASTAPAGPSDDGPASTTPTASTTTTSSSDSDRATATPSLSTLPSTSGVAIISPASNELVDPAFTIEGTAGGLPADAELWLVVRPLQGAEYFVPEGGGPVSVDGGAWRVALDLGREPEVVAGQQYIIFVVQADRAEGQALQSAADLTELPPGTENVAAVIVELGA